MRLIVGIDEVGRGPLAGPVSIGIVVCKKLLVMPELTDSKKMTEEA
ncbi:MAG TPA: ribonuclease HII, partial [Candidatus Paceibacterota bacterium]